MDVPRQVDSVRGRHGRWPRWLAGPGCLAALVVWVLALPASAWATGFTWTGADSSSSWSVGTNWGGTAPSGSVGTLTFPALTSASCTGPTPPTCYGSNNDITGLSANALDIDDGVRYFLSGNGITLGAGGITAAPSANDNGQIPIFQIPLTLSADQTWSITGGTSNQQLSMGSDANVTGSADTLGLAFSDQTFLDYDADAEVGAITATGSGTVALGSPTGPGSLNATDGNPVSFSGGAGLFAQHGATGPLTMSGGTIQVGVGGGQSSGQEQLTVMGTVSLNSSSSLGMSINQAGTTAGTDYSQLSATGNVNLGSATLDLGGQSSGGTCPTLTTGEVDTLITTTGSLTGTFSGLPDGSTTHLRCTGTEPTVKINYTSDSVTATVQPSDFTWSGAGMLGTDWSTGTNWVGDSAPSGSVGTLTFPALTGNGCTSASPSDNCYFSDNDISGLSANAISIDDGVGYSLQGDGITLGAGGLTAAPSANDNGGMPIFQIPLTLSADQTWSITGGSEEPGLSMQAPVTGSADTLGLALTAQADLNFNLSDVEVGAITATGTGANPGEVDLFGGSLNGTDHSTVSFSGGVAFDGSGTTGPLTMSGGNLVVGTYPGTSAGENELAVEGAASLDSTSFLLMYINSGGTAAGTDYSQLSATGNVNLGNATLGLGGQTSGGTCPTLNPGQVDTLITTSGSVTGTFDGIANGTVMQLDCPSPTPPTVEINYTSNSVTATVLGTPTTTTTLAASPTSPVTNQSDTLIATVSASSGAPSGAVEFDNNGSAISGCSAQPVSFNGTAYVATCTTAFTAASSPESLTATFTPATGSGLTGSTSTPADLLDVGRDGTTTVLGVSNTSPNISQNVTYTATVTPVHAGPPEPSGAVQFLDGGTPIGSCSSQPIPAGAMSSSATCTLSYAAAGSHSITAVYSGDGNFNGSTSSPAQTVTVPQPPSTSTPAVTVSQILAALSSVLSPHGKEATITALLKKEEYKFAFKAPEAGTLVITWYYLPKGAHISTAKKVQPVTIASGRLSLTSATAGNIVVRLTRKGKHLLKHAKTLKVTSKTVFTPTSGSPTTREKTFTLRR